VLERVKTLDPSPPRQRDHLIPRELERICLKCLAKRAADRYPTARDLADDLREFQLTCETPEPSLPAPRAAEHVVARSPDHAPASFQPSATQEATTRARIVPRGLRSFDAGDADFFLELLPGPRDRTGLPESVRFWKTRIEQPDPDRTFRVGVMYGPSGCGKSSLVSAGLLPRLSDDVRVVHVESAGEADRGPAAPRPAQTVP